jgi:hypothetical protein
LIVGGESAITVSKRPLRENVNGIGKGTRRIDKDIYEVFFC